jgi:hypothetical protein
MAANFESWFKFAYVNHPLDGAFACHLRAAWDAAVENGSSHNSDYTTALRIHKEYRESDYYQIIGFREYCEMRLNSAKAPNCA